MSGTFASLNTVSTTYTPALIQSRIIGLEHLEQR